MSTGADNKTMPVTVAYEDGYERTFGKREPVRGKWVWDPAQGHLVPAGEYRAPEAKYAPIMVDRFYEGARTTDGHDIGSRQKHRTYLKDRGLTTMDDFTDTWAKDAKEREARSRGEFSDKRERRDEVGRILYEVEKRHASKR